MAGEQDDLRVLPPSPLHEEQQPLLANGTPTDHGTIDRDGAAREEEGDEVPIAEEPTTVKVHIIMMSMWMGSFWAAMGESASTIPQSKEQ